MTRDEITWSEVGNKTGLYDVALDLSKDKFDNVVVDTYLGGEHVHSARSQRVFNEHPSCPYCARDVGVEVVPYNWNGELDCFNCGSKFFIDFEVDYTFYVRPVEASQKFAATYGKSHKEALESLGQIRIPFGTDTIDINKK
jgi:hypothetical protein